MTVTEAEGARRGNSLAECEGSVSSVTTDAASAWNSFCEVEGREAGATGTEGVSRFTQQAGVEQCLSSQPVQQQLLWAMRARALVGADAAKTPGQARTNPSRRTAAALTIRIFMAANWSFQKANPYGDCRILPREETLLLSASVLRQTAASGAARRPRRKTNVRFNS